MNREKKENWMHKLFVKCIFVTLTAAIWSISGENGISTIICIVVWKKVLLREIVNLLFLFSEELNENCRTELALKENPYTGGGGMQTLSSAGSCCHSSVHRHTSPRSSPRPRLRGERLHWAHLEPSWWSPETSCLSSPSQLEHQTKFV